MIDINHTNAEIDILKIDIEYSEYVFFHLLFSNNRQFQPIFIRQILIVRMQSIFFFFISYGIHFISVARKSISFERKSSKPMPYSIYLIRKIMSSTIEN